MTQTMLSGEEWDVIRGLRDVPAGGPRDELIGLVRDLVEFTCHPRCAPAQGDGVPCTSVDVACEDCRRVARVLSLLHQRLHAA